MSVKYFIIFILSISFISFSEATERKQPGVKYTDTLKQKRADKATAAGRVTPKQPGVNYNDTRQQTENNLSGSNSKIPGQSYSSTLKGTAEGKDRNNNRDYDVNRIGNFQDVTTKSKLKKKYGITQNTDNAFIDPTNGQVITQQDLDKMRVEVSKTLNSTAAAMGISKAEMATMFAKEITNGFEGFEDVLSEFDKDTARDIIEALVFVLNYAGIPVENSQLEIYLNKSKKVENQKKENLNDEYFSSTQNINVKNSSISYGLEDEKSTIQKFISSSANFRSVIKGMVKKDGQWNKTNVDNLLSEDSIKNLLVSEEYKDTDLKELGEIKTISVNNQEYKYREISLTHFAHRYGYIFSTLKGETLIEGFTFTQFNSPMPLEKLISDIELIEFL